MGNPLIISRRLGGEAVETLQQPLQPIAQRIGRVEDTEGADAASPLERAENGIVGIERRVAAEIGLCLQRQPQWRRAVAKRRQALLAIGGSSFERHAEALL